MSRAIHVICGEFGGLAEALAASSKEVVSLRDYLPAGPLRELSNVESWRATRLAFWDGVYSVTAKTAKRRRRGLVRWGDHPIVPEPDRFIDAEAITLWLGTGLSEQLVLAWMPQFLRAIGAPGANLNVVQFERNRSGEEITEARYLNLEGIQAAPAARAIGEAELAYLDVVWRGVTSPDPGPLMRLLHDRSAPLPRLREALHGLLWRYPDFRSGLSRQDASLLANTRDYGPAASGVIVRSIIALEKLGDRDGDVLLLWRLRRLANPALRHPAVTISGGQGLIAGAEVHLTDAGERIARCELNFVELNGIDEWVGGVHLDSGVDDVWFHRAFALVRR